MRAAAILGIFIFGALSYMFFYLGSRAHKEEKEGEILMQPAWTVFLVAILSLFITILCVIYALGFWDAFIGWLHAGDSGHFVIRQY